MPVRRINIKVAESVGKEWDRIASDYNLSLTQAIKKAMSQMDSQTLKLATVEDGLKEAVAEEKVVPVVPVVSKASTFSPPMPKVEKYVPKPQPKGGKR